MSLRSIAAADNKEILNNDGDPITLIASDDTEYDVTGQVMRVDAQLDPDTRVQYYQPKFVVTISLDDLPVDIDGDGLWRVRTTDVTGTTFTRRVIEVRYDRTISFVNLLLEEFE